MWHDRWIKQKLEVLGGVEQWHKDENLNFIKPSKEGGGIMCLHYSWTNLPNDQAQMVIVK